MRRASYAEVAQWVVDAWEGVPDVVVCNEFRHIPGCSGGAEGIVLVNGSVVDPHPETVLADEMRELFHSDDGDSDFEVYA